jgi:hypothetical protein
LTGKFRVVRNATGRQNWAGDSRVPLIADHTWNSIGDTPLEKMEPPPSSFCALSRSFTLNFDKSGMVVDICSCVHRFYMLGSVLRRSSPLEIFRVFPSATSASALDRAVRDAGGARRACRYGHVVISSPRAFQRMGNRLDRSLFSLSCGALPKAMFQP